LTDEIFDLTDSPEDEMLARLETFAHLEHLRRRGQVKQLDGGCWTRRGAERVEPERSVNPSS